MNARFFAFVFLFLAAAHPGGSLAAGDATGILSAAEARQKALRNEVVLIDIRQPSEWRETGIPAGGRPLTMHRRDFLQALLQLVGGDRSTPLAIICATGGRSAMVRKLLIRQGFASVMDVSEGMLGNFRGPGWLRRGLPVSAYVE